MMAFQKQQNKILQNQQNIPSQKCEYLGNVKH
jgi:hypothetical protein